MTRASVQEFGAAGDGQTDDGPAFQRAFLSGRPLIVPPTPAGYVWAGARTFDLVGDVDCDFQGALIKCVSTASQGLQMRGGPAPVPTLSLREAIPREATSAVFLDASSVREGDLHDLSEAVVAEKTFNTPRRQLALVRAVDGDTVIYRNRLRVPFSPAAAVLARRPPRRVVLRDLNLVGVGIGATATALITLAYLVGPEVTGPRLVTDQTGYAAGGTQLGWGLYLANCVGATVDRPHLEGLSYGLPVVNCQGTLIRGVTARNVRHPVMPGGWSVGTLIQGMVTQDCYISVDSHAAFETHYRDVLALRDESYPNLRCVGGSLIGCTGHVTTGDAEPGPYYHNLALVDPSWYDTAHLTVADVVLDSPARTRPVVGANRGHAHFRNVAALSAAGAFPATLKSLSIADCRNPDGSSWGV